MSPKFFILTREHNEYDQFGKYFVAVFVRQPTADEIKSAVLRDDESQIDDALAAYISRGGGRQGDENVWWHLTEHESANSQC